MSSRSQLVLGVLLAVTGVTLFLTVARSATGEEQVRRPDESATARWVSESAPTPPGPTTGAPTAPVEAATSSASLIIPRTGAEVPVVRGTDASALAAGAGQWANGTELGGRGNLVIVSSTRPDDAAARLDVLRLRRGDRVVVQTASYRYVYEMDTAGDAFRVTDEARWPLLASPGPAGPGGRVLTLLTRTTDPASDRRVGFGHLEVVRLRRAVGSATG